MTADQLPLWHDGWEAEADAKATIQRPRRWSRKVPSDHGRSFTRAGIPHRPVVNVIRSL